MNRTDKKIRLLRPVRNTSLISAAVFEKLFIKHLGDVLEIVPVPLEDFCDSILGTLENPNSRNRAAELFREYTREYDFFCPAYECIPLSPLFMSLRNAGKSNIRLLFIAHSAGAYAMEWALIRPLLVPGDIIVAPSRCAKDTIAVLCPELSWFVHVINHPIDRLPKIGRDKGREQGNIRIVTLGRIDPSKLIHRQIEAMEILGRRGHANIKMHIAGPLDDPETGELTIYARSLSAKVKRLGLENRVFLEGLIKGDVERARFLSSAHLSLNLSNSIEESFPKASVEPLGLGIPVIACAWNGFVETVGDCGKLIPQTEIVDGFLDIQPERIADAVEELLSHPIPAERCIRQARKFLPGGVKKRYLEVLTGAVKLKKLHLIPPGFTGNVDGMITGTRGLIGKIACLMPFTWNEMMANHLDYSKRLRWSWRGREINEVATEAVLRTLLLLSLYTPLAYLYAGKNHEKWTCVTEAGKFPAEWGRQLPQRIAGAVGPGAIISSNIACLYALAKDNSTALLAKCLEQLEDRGVPARSLNYYKSEVDCQLGDYEKAYNRYAEKCSKESMTCYDSQCLRHIARICREWQKPCIALPWLREWLEKHPDEPDSGSVWLAYAYNLLYSANIEKSLVDEAVGKVKDLLGNLPCVHQLERAILMARWRE